MPKSALWLIVAALFVPQLPVRAQSSGWPHGGGFCLSDEDCSLGGVCDNSTWTCSCDVWFTGENCRYLNLQRPLDTNAGTCGPQFDNYFSWGGRTVLPQPGTGGNYSAVVSFMCRHETLGAWTTASSDVRFTSPSPAGPYSWGAEQCDGEICTPTVPPWAHNTVVIDNPLADPSERFQIWHCGDSSADQKDWSPCYNSSEAGPGKWPPPAREREAGYSPLKYPPGSAAYVSTAPTPSGPWTRWRNNSQIPLDFNGSWADPNSLANAMPVMLPNGTALLYFTDYTCPKGSGNLAPPCIAMGVSNSGWQGPYKVAANPITFPESEDPSVFIDPRGNFHLLTNVNTYHKRCSQGVPCGGHAWSRDGISFSNLTIGAFGPVMTFANGSIWQNAYVERPHVTLGSDGRPLAFYVGLGRNSYDDSCSWPQLFCTGAPGEMCGPTRLPPPTVGGSL